MFNPMGIDPIRAHQQSLQQLQQLLPTIKAVDAVFPSMPSRAIDEIPLDREPYEQVEIHSVIDYDPWLKHLYRLWQQQLVQHYGALVNMPAPNPHIHWVPETTSAYIHELAMRYLGWLKHHQHWRLLDAMILLTQQWELTWRESWSELDDANSSRAVKEVLANTANLFHRQWLATCVRMIEEQDHPSVPKV
jgi:hypothetical protein